jgi:NAD(P)H-hydrate epimerase
MAGAAVLSCRGALRSGSGLVTAATPASLSPIVAGAVSEATGILLPEGPSGSDSKSAAVSELAYSASVRVALRSLGEGRFQAVGIGPGLGTDLRARAVLEAVLKLTRCPIVIDADALNLLALTRRARDSWVLTPHPGEAARLLGSSTHDVQADRLGAATQLQARYGGTVVLKGAGSIVQGSVGPGWICDRGNPGMAAPGMGDVLTGVIAGIAGQCGDLALAARAGVLAHAMAGDRAAAGGERGLIASDVMAELRACVNPR